MWCPFVHLGMDSPEESEKKSFLFFFLVDIHIKSRMRLFTVIQMTAKHLPTTPLVDVYLYIDQSDADQTRERRLLFFLLHFQLISKCSRCSYVVVLVSPRSGRRISAVHVSEGARPTFHRCSFTSDVPERACIHVSGKRTRPTITQCIIKNSANAGICVENGALVTSKNATNPLLLLLV